MATRATIRRTVIIGGTKVTNKLEGFQKPKFKKKYADSPGSFVGKKEHVGFDAAEWELTIKGASATIIRSALIHGEDTIVTYTEKGREGSERWVEEHVMTGEVDYELLENKMGEQQGIKLTGQIEKYDFTENGTAITVVDIENGDYMIGGKVY